MTRKSTTNDFIIIPASAFELREGDVAISEKEQQDIILHRKLFDKFIDAAIYKFRVDNANFKYVGKESEVYLGVKTLQELKLSIDNTEKNYKIHLEKVEAEKERKKKEKQSANEK